MTEPVRLSKRMSELGLCSRREADAWIEKGWVRVDGKVVSVLGSKVLPNQRRGLVTFQDAEVFILAAAARLSSIAMSLCMKICAKWASSRKRSSTLACRASRWRSKLVVRSAEWRRECSSSSESAPC